MYRLIHVYSRLITLTIFSGIRTSSFQRFRSQETVERGDSGSQVSEIRNQREQEVSGDHSGYNGAVLHSSEYRGNKTESMVYK